MRKTQLCNSAIAFSNSVHTSGLVMPYIMVTSSTDSIISSANQPQSFTAKPSVNYLNCVLVHEQLHSALIELQSAITIISLLREDFNKVNTSEATNIPMQSLPCESSGYEKASDQWIPVVHCSDKKKKMPTVTSMKTDQSSIYSNRFSPLTNLNKNQADDISPMSDCEQSSTNSIETITVQSNAVSKTPTIINGRFTRRKTKKPLQTIKNSSCVPSNKTNKYENKVKIIGDSHLKASTTRINHFLNTKFEVCSFIKPGASANQLVHSQETKFM